MVIRLFIISDRPPIDWKKNPLVAPVDNSRSCWRQQQQQQRQFQPATATTTLVAKLNIIQQQRETFRQTNKQTKKKERCCCCFSRDRLLHQPQSSCRWWSDCRFCLLQQLLLLTRPEIKETAAKTRRELYVCISLPSGWDFFADFWSCHFLLKKAGWYITMCCLLLTSTGLDGEIWNFSWSRFIFDYITTTTTTAFFFYCIV